MKESFILYTEQKEIVDKLSDEKAGQLFKSLYEYVATGETTIKDDLINIIIIPFKQSIDRNADKWEKERLKRSEAGKKGMANRWKHNNTDITSNNTDNNVMSDITNISDNVNVNVNDNVNVNVNGNVSNNNIIAPSNSKKNCQSQEAIIKIPLIDKSYFDITKEDIDKWGEIYPAVNIMQEFRNMLGWCDSHPKNRKTRRGIKAFINNWLSRSQDKSKIETTDLPKKIETKNNNDSNDLDSQEYLDFLNGMLEGE